MVRIPELLAPAGTMEKAKTAVAYGADALYLAGRQYGLRAHAGNFTRAELQEILTYAHERGVRVYAAVNLYAHENDLSGLPPYLAELAELKVDGLILADPGVWRLARRYAPGIPLHVSTQANTTNSEAVLFWQDLGVQRIILARELSQAAIAAIRDKVDIELEVFVHGAMCVAYSGRCLLSHVLTGRSANQGACAQSCRWSYALMEEKRPGEYLPVEEDARGTYVFNSHDLCLIEHLPALVELGIDAVKIEGRMKSLHYVAAVVKAYRQALDAYAQAGPERYQLPDGVTEELTAVSHRPYSSGFFAVPDTDSRPGLAFVRDADYRRRCDFVGVIRRFEQGRALVAVRNRLAQGENLEILRPRGRNRRLVWPKMYRFDTDEPLIEAHANDWVWVDLSAAVEEWSLVRRDSGRIAAG